MHFTNWNVSNLLCYSELPVMITEPVLNDVEILLDHELFLSVKCFLVAES